MNRRGLTTVLAIGIVIAEVIAGVFIWYILLFVYQFTWGELGERGVGVTGSWNSTVTSFRTSMEVIIHGFPLVIGFVCLLTIVLFILARQPESEEQMIKW